MEPSIRLIFLAVILLFLVSCSLPGNRLHVSNPPAQPNREVKILGINFFRVQVDRNINMRQLINGGNYYEISKLIFENKIITPLVYLNQEINKETVVEFIYMPEERFISYELIDDQPRIIMIMNFMGYRPATLRELLTVAVDYKVPFVLGGKVVAFGSYHLEGHFFYIDRTNRGRRLLSKPTGERWRDYNVLFAVVKK